MVVLFHFKPNSHFLHVGLIRHSYLFVDFFFVLSGFVIFEAYRDKLRAGFGLRRFILLRLGRIYPLHLFLLICFVVFEFAWMFWLSRYSSQPRPAFEEGNSLPALAANVVLLQSFRLFGGTSWNYPAWSIGAEFWTYLLFAAAIVRTPAASLTRVLWILALAGWVASWTIALLLPSAADANGFPRCVYGLALGALLRGFHRDFAWQSWLASIAELATIVLCLTFVATADGHAAMSLAPPIFAMAVATFAQQKGLISRLLISPPFAILGNLSYSIYMVHVLVILLGTNAVSVVEKLSGHSLRSSVTVNAVIYQGIGLAPWQGDVAYVVVLALVIFVAAQTYRFVEAPWRESSRQLARKLEEPGPPAHSARTEAQG
jgi:peptidoglycan/LPS O-acetylase OafA/YrhL